MRVCDAWIRSQEDPCTQQPAISLICASTALAAQNFKHATTAHALFKIPADDIGDGQEEGPLKSLLPNFPGQQALLDEAALIGWDEFPSAHRVIFEAVFDAMQSFRSKILLCTGDLRQLTPVVKSSIMTDQLHASIVYSRTWTHFTRFSLRINFRQAADPQYSQFAEAIGEGRDGGDYSQATNYHAEVDLASMIPVSQRFQQTTTKAALRWIYPQIFDETITDPVDRARQMATRAICANTNERVNYWNDQVQKRLPRAESRTYFSENKLCDASHEHDRATELMTQELMHYCDKGDIPAHELKLKVGDLCILMRNIDKTEGLTNNQRIIVRGFRNRAVVISIASDRRGKVYHIERHKFKTMIPGTAFEMVRKQFPIKLAYAFTVHKAQGQELQAALLDTIASTFAHGQLYVALSRTRSRNGIAVFLSPEQAAAGTVLVDNVVFPELINFL